MHKLTPAIVTAALFAAGTAFAADAAPAAAPAAEPAASSVTPPTPEQLKAVWAFFEHGKGQGIVLGDAKLCTEIGKSGEQKSECTQEVPAEGVKAGTLVWVWQAYMVPNGDEVNDLAIQVKQGDVVRETKDVSVVKGTYWRERTWSGVTLRKPGTWTISIMRGNNVLKAFSVKVL